MQIKSITTFCFFLATCVLFSCNNNTNSQHTQTPQTENTPPPPPVDENFTKGEILFNQYCISCHGIDKMLVGPALKGIPQKYANDKEWLYEYIRDNQKMIQNGDKKAVALYNANDKKQMLSFPFLKNEDIDAILVYIEKFQKSE